MQNPVISHPEPKTIKQFSESDDITVLVTTQPKNSKFLARIDALAATYRDRYSFAVVDGAVTTVTCYNNVDSTQHQGQNLEQISSLEKLVQACAEPLIPQLTRRNEMKYVSVCFPAFRTENLLTRCGQGAKSLVYYFQKDEVDRDSYVETMRETARMYHEFLTLVTVDADEYPHMPASLGLSGKGSLAVQNLHNGEVFHYLDHTITADNVANFIFAISEGKVDAWDGVTRTERASHDEL